MWEARLRAVVNTVANGVILIDHSGSILMSNPACERLFGYSADEILGRNIKILMPEPFYADLDSYFANPGPGDRKAIGLGREVFGRREDGSTFPMALWVGEATQSDETFFVGVIDDITDRRRAEAQRERLIEELATSNEELGYFARIASHDLQEPLRMVSALCGLLSDRYGERLDDSGREYLTLAVTAAKQMRDLLDDLLDYGRLGLEAERASWFDAGECFREALEYLQESIRESGAIVTIDPLPRLLGNPIRFTRLAQNLVGNALKYVAPGTTPRVRVSAERSSGDHWLFHVSDNGIGIDAIYHEKIFEPFKRLHAKTEYYGTGLGLAICKKIVEGFGGNISVTSSLGNGATFSCTVKQIAEECDE